VFATTFIVVLMSSVASAKRLLDFVGFLLGDLTPLGHFFPDQRGHEELFSPLAA
jgi:hypothetical protein